MTDNTIGRQLDEAFNWLVLILTIIGGTLSQFAEINPLGGPETPEQTTIALIRLLIFPVLILVFTWLWGYLSRKRENQIILKSLSWILASIILMADVVLLTIGTFHPNIGGGPNATILELAIGFSILLSPLYFSLLFCLFVIRPRMREAYQESKFLHNFPMQILVYIAAVFLYFLSTGLLEGLLGITPI